MGYAVTIAVPAAPPALIGRVLAKREDVETLREVRDWVRRNAETWRDALEPGEPGFVAFVTDDDGTPALTIQHSRQWGDNGVETGRATLREMRAVMGTAETSEGGDTT